MYVIHHIIELIFTISYGLLKLHGFSQQCTVSILSYLGISIWFGRAELYM